MPSDTDALCERILRTTWRGDLAADVRAAFDSRDRRIAELERLLTEAKPWVEAHQEYESTEQRARALAEQIDAALTPPPREEP